jgi:hypothetical protein
VRHRRDRESGQSTLLALVEQRVVRGVIGIEFGDHGDPLTAQRVQSVVRRGTRESLSPELAERAAGFSGGHLGTYARQQCLGNLAHPLAPLVSARAGRYRAARSQTLAVMCPAGRNVNRADRVDGAAMPEHAISQIQASQSDFIR